MTYSLDVCFKSLFMLNFKHVRYTAGISFLLFFTLLIVHFAGQLFNFSQSHLSVGQFPEILESYLETWCLLLKLERCPYVFLSYFLYYFESLRTLIQFELQSRLPFCLINSTISYLLDSLQSSNANSWMISVIILCYIPSIWTEDPGKQVSYVSGCYWIPYF